MSTSVVNTGSEKISDKVESPTEEFVFILTCHGDPTKADTTGLKCRLRLVPPEGDSIDDHEGQTAVETHKEPPRNKKVEEDKKNDEGDGKGKGIVDAQDNDHQQEAAADPAEIDSQFWKERTNETE